MDDNRVTGTARDAFGRAQEAVGDFAGDARTRARGKMNQVRGQAEDAAGQMSDLVREQPLTSLLIGVGIGYLLGRLRIV